MVLNKFGGVANFAWVERPVPTVAPDQLGIEVKAVGLNFGDILIRQGLHAESPKPPAVHGSEVAGVIVAIGSELSGRTSFNVGDRVAAYLPNYGGYAEYVSCSPDYVTRLHDSRSFVEGAAFPVNFVTAALLVNKIANVTANETVLIHGAGGGFDVVFDSLGGSSLRKSYAMLGRFGRLCMFGASSFVVSRRQNWLAALINLLSFPVFFPLTLIRDSRSVCGFGILQVGPREPTVAAALKDVVRLWDDGAVHPVVDRTFPLEQLGQAQDYLQGRKSFGKVVLTL